MRFLDIYKKVFSKVKQYKKIILLALAIWIAWSLGVGSFTGWLISSHSPGLDKLPDITSKDRILVLAPHIDDEVIGAGGVIQQALAVGAKVKIVYFTNGDENFYALIGKKKNIKFTPNDFIKLGEQRMEEARKATKVLGLNNQQNLVFLGYPDHGLIYMFSSFYNKPFTAKGTEFKYNPYSGTFERGQEYTGKNVVSSLEKIINDFQPTIIFVTHPRDLHPDHKAAFLFLWKVMQAINYHCDVFAYVVHYHKFPLHKGLFTDEFLYPPKRLFTKVGWFGFNLTKQQEQNKLKAIKLYHSQFFPPSSARLLESFVRRNEVFERMEKDGNCLTKN